MCCPCLKLIPLYTFRILAHLRTAAGPDTKLLIVDQVLPLACVEEASVAFPEGSLAPANSPLLPNLGKAYVVGYHMDMLVSRSRLLVVILVEVMATLTLPYEHIDVRRIGRKGAHAARDGRGYDGCRLEGRERQARRGRRVGLHHPRPCLTRRSDITSPSQSPPSRLNSRM